MRRGLLSSAIDAVIQVYRFADLIQLTKAGRWEFSSSCGELGVFSILVVQPLGVTVLSP